MDEPVGHIGDQGYQGLGMITPIKKRKGQEHLDQGAKDFNRSIGQIRYKIEQVIANLKVFRILFTDYRRPHDTHPETITAAIGLAFLKTNFP